MKKILGILALTLALTSCSLFSSKKSDTPAYNPYVDAFTSGRVSRSAPIYLIFSSDVDSARRTNKALSKNLHLRPAVSGSWAWEDEHTAVFRPSGELRRKTQYSVTANIGAFFDATGDTRRFTFSFETMPFAVRAGAPQIDADAENDNHYHITLEVESADAESPETIEKFVDYSSLPSGVKVEWDHTAQGTTHTLQLKGFEAGDTANQITLRTTDKTDLTSFSIPAKTDFSVYSVSYVSTPEKYVEVTFTKSLDAKQKMRGLAYIEGNKNETVTVDGSRLRLYPDVQKVGQVTVFLSRTIRSDKGLKLGEDNLREVQVSSEFPGIRFVGRGVIIPRSSELSVPFEAVWLRGVTVNVTRIYEKNVGQFLQVNRLDGTHELNRVGRLVARKTIWLDEQNRDLSMWNTYAVDLRKLIEPEPGAIYRIELDMRRDLSAYPGAQGEKSTPKTKEQIAAEDEVAFRSQLSSADHGGYYYYEDGDYWEEDYYYDPDYKWDERENPRTYSFYVGKQISRNVLATDMGLIVKSGQRGNLTAIVHNLLTAAPMGDVAIEARNYQGQTLATATTDATGVATLDVGTSKVYLAIASQGAQRTYLRVDSGQELSTSSFDTSGEQVQQGIKGFIYGDRGVWRPGDTMHLSFMLSDSEGTLPANVPVVMELVDPMGQLYLRKTQTRGELGLYAFDMPTEPDARTGAWSVRVEVGGANFSKRIRIETIKPNRLKINLDFDGKKTLLAGKSATGALHVEWLTGAVARGLSFETDASVRSITTRFAGFEGYNFDDRSKRFESRDVRIATGKVDESGNATIAMELNTGSNAPGMLVANLVTKVYEESGDFSIDGRSIDYSPYERYVGVRTPQEGYGQLATGRDHRFGVALVDHTGKPLSGNVKVEIYKVEWYWWWSSYGSNLANYMSRSHNRPVDNFTVNVDATGKASFTMNRTDDQWGTYYIRLSDTAGRHTSGTMAYFDWPDSYRRHRDSANGATELVFQTDKNTYAPGETMRVTLPSSAGARAVVSIENGTGVVSVASHECTAKETTLSIPVTDAMQPNVYVHVSLLQPHGATKNDVPIRLYGIVPVRVTSPESRLAPVIKAPAEIKPEARYEISVGEKSGRPMAYTLAIVDEGLLDLTHFATPDPWEVFNAREALGVSSFDMYNYVVGAYGGRIEQLFSIGGDAEIEEGGEKNSVNRFKPVVRFEGPFRLKRGETRTHTYTMDNYNGRVRVMVVAGDGRAYGSADQSVVVRKPVMLLGTLPRVIGTGEEMDVPATVFATEDGVGEVKVKIECSDGMTVVGDATKTLNFKEMGDKTIAFRVRTSKKPGAGKVTLTATGKGDKSIYATDIEIRAVRREQVKVTAATLEGGKTWSEKVPFPGADGTNSVALEVSNVPPVNLASRLGYLLGYPHGCLEQITSKAFPQLYVGGFADLTGRQKLDAEQAIAATIRRYKSYQTAEGAFAYWPGQSSTDAYTSIYAMHFLLEAASKGYQVPAALRRSVLNNLQLVARGWRMPKDTHYNYSEQFIQAYRLYVLALSGGAEAGAMNRLREEKNLTAAARWMLSAAYIQAGRKDVAEQLVASTVPMSETYNSEYDITYGSPLRDKAVKLIVLTMLDRAAEAAELCKDISTSLSSDEWISTQSTAYALLAVSRYAQKYTMGEKMQFAYQVAGEKGTINSDRSIWTSTLAEKAAAGSVSAKVENTGKPTLFLRLITTGTPDEGNEEAYAYNVALDVKYTDARGNGLDVASLTKGDPVTAVVTVRNPTSKAMRNLALTQIFPSGWEILSTRFMNDEVFTNESRGDTPSGGISYQDIRDDRVYTYIDYLGAGRSVTVKLNLAATYGGRFYLPPVWCEAMYDFATRANTEGMQVEVK